MKLSSDKEAGSSDIFDMSMLNIAKKPKIYFFKYNPDFLKPALYFLVLRKSLCLSV